jgi:ribonuclease P protein component
VPDEHFSPFRDGLSTAWGSLRLIRFRSEARSFGLTVVVHELSNGQLFVMESVHETHLSTFESPPAPDARIQSQAKDAQWARSVAGSPGEGARPPCGVTAALRLPRTARLHDAETIKLLHTAAPARRGHWFLLRRVPNKAGYPRLLIRVAKKIVRAAVSRNRVRRCIRESFRLRRLRLPAADYCVTVKAPISVATLSEVRQELERLLQLEK